LTNKDYVISALRKIGKQQASDLREKTVAGSMTATELIAQETSIPTWRQGSYNTVGAPVQLDGQVYKVTQAHNSTANPDWKPGVAYSLFDLMHTTDPAAAKPYIAPQGSWGLYQQGEYMVWTDGKTYKSKIANNAYTPETYPAGWELYTA
jgi:hypothetical protein